MNSWWEYILWRLRLVCAESSCTRIPQSIYLNRFFSPRHVKWHQVIVIMHLETENKCAFMLQPTSCPRPGLSSSAQSSRTCVGGDAGVCVKASTSLSLHYQAPWDSLRVIKSHSHWQGKLLGSYLDLLISLLFLHQTKRSHTCRKTRSTARCVSLIQAARGLTIIQQHTVQLTCTGVHTAWMKLWWW